MISVHSRSFAAKNIYVELHSRSAFSFLQGSSTPEELVTRAAELNIPALAILDRDNISGAARFHMSAKKAGIRAHIGAEVTCTDGHRYPLLAESRTGYQNLCRLATRMKLRAKKGEGAATPEELAEFAKGLICLAPAERELGSGIWDLAKPDRPSAKYQTLNPKSAYENLQRLIDIFGRPNVFAEIQRHMNREKEARNQEQIAAARRLRMPLVATNGV